MAPQAYCDDIAAKFQATWKRVGISNDDFIRTTEPRHKAAVAEMWKRLVDAGDIYDADYEGLYCVGCEECEDRRRGRDRGRRRSSARSTERPVERVKEKNYFFRLSKYAAQLLDFYAADAVASCSPSRATTRCARSSRAGCAICRCRRIVGQVGHPGPRRSDPPVYVWIDALTNYLTALGGPDAVARGDGQGGVLGRRAPPDRQGHPALPRRLLAGDAWSGGPAAAQADLLPRLPDGEGPEDLEVACPPPRSTPTRSPTSWASIRCATSCCASTRSARDGDFSYEALFQRYESDLGNDLGNLLNRTVSLAAAANVRRRATVATAGRSARRGRGLRPAALAGIDAARLGGLRARRAALEATWAMIREANALHRSDGALEAGQGRHAGRRCDGVLADACEAIRWAALMVAPAMPAAAREILRQIGRGRTTRTLARPEWPAGRAAR